MKFLSDIRSFHYRTNFSISYIRLVIPVRYHCGGWSEELFFPLANPPFAPLSWSPLLTWNPPCCDRIRLPWSLVARKLISSLPSLPICSPFRKPDPDPAKLDIWYKNLTSFFIISTSGSSPYICIYTVLNVEGLTECQM